MRALLAFLRLLGHVAIIADRAAAADAFSTARYFWEWAGCCRRCRTASIGVARHAARAAAGHLTTIRTLATRIDNEALAVETSPHAGGAVRSGRAAAEAGLI